MLTADLDRLDVRAGMVVLDLGCGTGRHSFEALRRAAHTISVDLDRGVLRETAGMTAAMRSEGELRGFPASLCVAGDARALPFPDAAFDRVIASEVLEHIVDDEAAIAELARVLKPGGLAAVTVPRFWPERVCWALSEDYHRAGGGHVRIYRSGELSAGLRRAGLVPVVSTHAHALHVPYWWLRCLCGMDGDASVVPRAYHAFLVWDLSAPRPTRWLETALNPVMGKSLIIYAAKPAIQGADAG